MIKKTIVLSFILLSGIVNASAQWRVFQNEMGKFGLELEIESGEIIRRINAKYDSILFCDNPNVTNDFDLYIPISENRIGVKLGISWGFIDTSGREITPIKYDKIGPYSNGFAWVQRKGKQTWVNFSGKEISPFLFDCQPNTKFQEGKCKISINRSWGFIDTTGKIIVQPRYRNVGNFSDQLAWVQNGSSGNFGYINEAGVEVIPATRDYAKVYPFSEGLAAIETPFMDEEDPGILHLLIGFINKKGELVIPFQFQSGINYFENEYKFKNDRLKVTLKDGKEVIINRKGEIIQN